MKRIERLALPQGLSGMYGHLFIAALSNMLKWNHPKADKTKAVSFSPLARCVRFLLFLGHGFHSRSVLFELGQSRLLSPPPSKDLAKVWVCR